MNILCRILALGIVFLLIFTSHNVTSQAKPYSSMACDELWYARNSIFAEKGYCFKSKRARQTFGARCFPPYGKLTSSEQSEVELIRQFERQLGCSGSATPTPSPGPAPSPAPSPQPDQYAQMNCYELWYARNAIYAEKGYCFKTKRARRVFGEACFPPYGKLNASEQSRVNRIVREEGRKGCR